MEEESESPERYILYDLLQIKEWAEITRILDTERGLYYLWRKIATNVHAFLQTSLDKLKHPIRYLSSSSSPSTIVKLLNARLPWKLAITSDGHLLAVLKDDVIEIRSILEDFERVNATIPVGVDLCPEWRQLVWSDDGYVLAFANSVGEVYLFSPSGKGLGEVGRVTVSESRHTSASLTQAVAAMTFIPPLKDKHDQDVLVLLNILFYDGTLETYEIRGNSPPVHAHSFSFSSYFPDGLTAMAYVAKHNLLLVGGSPYSSGEGVACGVSGWRLLDAPPYWGPRVGQQLRRMSAGEVLGELYFKRKEGRNLKNSVFSMSLSPCSSLLAVIDLSGCLAIWEIPSLRLKTTFELDQLPVRQVRSSKKAHAAPLEVSWWTDKALVLVNEAGEVSVMSTSTLRDLLGNAPLSGWSITPTYNQQFFMLKCEMSQKGVVQRYRVPSLSVDAGGEEQEEEDLQNEDTGFSLSRFSSDLVKQVLYFVTDSERFIPEYKKKLKYQAVTRKYSLLCMKAITPAESYERKLVRGEYEEALELAREYELDSDLVHQRQWHNYQVSISTIQDYLGKVSKVLWVLRECLNRPTSDFSTTRYLLKYGLSRTSFRELKDLDDLQLKPSSGKMTADGRRGAEEDNSQQETTERNISISEDEGENMERSGEEEEDGEEGMIVVEECVEDVLKEMHEVEKLSVDQLSMCQFRHMILSYLDRLDTYQIIVDRGTGDDSLFDWNTYTHFRSENLVTSALGYARDSNWPALEVLFTYHGDVLLPHRMAILSNFPETTPPHRYASLLPVIGSEGKLSDWRQKEHRQSRDWVEYEVTRKLACLSIDPNTNYGYFIYDGNSQWLQYLKAESLEQVRSWYVTRAAEIEEYSGQVDSALALIELALENGITDLKEVLHELKTLYTLVYECGTESRLSWKKLKSLTDLEIIQMMMKETTDQSEFVSAMESRVLPFLTRLEAMAAHRSKGLLKNFMKILSKSDLRPCLMLLHQSNEVLDSSLYEEGEDGIDGGGRQPVIPQARDRLDLAITCIHACQEKDQLDVANQIIECLPTREADSSDSADLHDLVDALENYISAAGILKQYQVLQPVSQIKTVQGNPEEARQLLVKLTRVASRRSPAMTESGWRTLLHHLLTLRKNVFSFIDLVTCYKIYIESLLCSGMDANIQLAVQHLSLEPSSTSDATHFSSLQTTQGDEDDSEEGDSDEEEGRLKEAAGFRLSYAISVELVVGAAKEYFNSAANLMDKDMDLARSCLCLFPYPGPEVQAELNLIASLALLDDFKVSMLPIQVRLCDNKLDIVRNILDSTPASYKRHEKIVHLCRLLEKKKEEEVDMVDGSEVELQSGWGVDEDQGHALILIILSALEKKDFRLAMELSSQLMAAQFSPAWEVCRSMALNYHMADLSFRMALLDFSITHCPPEELVALLQSKKLLYLQSQLLRCGISEKKAPRVATQSSGGGMAGEVHGGGRGLMGKSAQLVSFGAGAVQSWINPDNTDVSSEVVGQESLEQTVEDSVTKLKDHIAQLEKKTQDSRNTVLPQNLQHRFYKEHGKKSERKINKREETLERLVLSLQTLLHCCQLALALSPDHQLVNADCKEVVLKLAELLSVRDAHLTVGHLLDVHEIGGLDMWQSRVSLSRYSLELLLYVVALQLCIVTAASTPGESGSNATPSDVYQISPAELLDHVMSSVRSCDLEKWSKEQEPWVVLLNKYERMLAEHNQAETLLDLGLGIEVDQFAKDEDYRRSIITSLARSSDEKIFSTALSQAHRHGIDLWEVHMSLLESLLTTSSSSVEDIEKKLDARQVWQSITRNPQKSKDYLEESVYPQLSGKKLDRLLLYYLIVQKCIQCGAQQKVNANIDVHIKVLNNLKQAGIQGVDYKVLMCGEGDPLLQLLPLLSSSNVHMVADIAEHIPCGHSAVLTRGMVICAYALKVFWSPDKTSSKSAPKDSLKRFEQCKEYLKHLSPAQFQHFMLGIAVCKKSLELPLESRCRLIKSALQFCENHILHEASAGSVLDRTMSQNELISILKKYLLHLTAVKDRLAEKDPNLSEEIWQKFKTDYDLSLAQYDKVEVLVQELVRCGASPECVRNILQCVTEVHPDQSANTATLYQESLRQLLMSAVHECSAGSHGNDGSSDEIDGSPSQSNGGDESVRKIFTAVANHETGGGTVVSSKDLITVLTPFCQDHSNPFHLRKLWFSLIDQHLFLSEEDHHLLLYHHTQSLMENVFSHKVKMEDVAFVDGQKQLFASLLKNSENENQFRTLHLLLDCWTEAGSRSLLIDCWVDLLQSLSARPGKQSYQEVLQVRAGLTGVPEQVDEEVLSRATSAVSALKYSLLCEGDLFDKTLHKDKEMEVSAETDKDLMELLLLKKKALPLRVARHPLYNQLHQYIQNSTDRGPASRNLFAKLLDCQDSELEERLGLADRSQRVKEVAAQLYGGDFAMEAGALLVATLGFHRELSTVADSLSYARKLFS